MEKYLDTTLSPEERAEALLSVMSLDEKIGQIQCVWPKDLEEHDEMEPYPYGVGEISATYVRMLNTREEAVRFQRVWQEAAMARSPHRIPAVFHAEGVNGAMVPGGVSFPGGIGRAASFDPELEREIGRIITLQVRAFGVGHVLAPVLDISRDPRNGRMSETYGEDPTLAAAMGSAYARGILDGNGAELLPSGAGAEGVAKHFLGFHAATGGIQSSHAEISDATLREVYAKPFQAAISLSALRGVMPCYDTLNGMPVSLSEEILTGLLRDEMGFDGVAVSDYSAVSNAYHYQGLCESEAEAGYRALSAGMDNEMPSVACFGEELKSWFADGKADIRILDRAVLRMLTAKFRMGLFEHPFAPDPAETDRFFADDACSEIGRKSASESLVLLKNNGILPLDKKNPPRKIALIGPHALSARFYFGGYTHFSMAEGTTVKHRSEAAEQQGTPIPVIPGTPVMKDDDTVYEALLRRRKPGIENLAETLSRYFPDSDMAVCPGYDYAGDDRSGFGEALKAAAEADLVILTLGGKNGTRTLATMGEGIDAANIGLPPAQEAFIKELAALRKPGIGIHFDGRPISSDAADETLDALLEAWSPAEFGGEAIARVLTGEDSPSGRLPVTVLRGSGQIPLYYSVPNGSGFVSQFSIGYDDYVDMPHRPRYPFGFGLTYSAFAYEDLRIENDGPESVCVTVRLTNVGKRDATETVQLYLRDPHASVNRPNRELAGFSRIHLGAGESGSVRFRVPFSQVAFLTRDRRWLIEAGRIDVLVGASSEDIRLQGDFHIPESRVIDGKTRSFFCSAEHIAGQ